MAETVKQRIERELRETFEQMRGPEMSFEKLREEYHRKCDEVVTLREKISQMETNSIENAMNADSRERKQLEASLTAERKNSQKARDERDAALMKLAKIKTAMERSEYFLDIIGAEDPLLPATVKPKSAISLHNKEDGVWLGIHAASTGRSALIRLDVQSHGRLVRQTLEDYFKERVPGGAAATRST